MVTDKVLLGVFGVGTLLLSGCVALEVTKIKKLNDIQKEIEYFEWQKGVYYNRKDTTPRGPKPGLKRSVRNVTKNQTT